MKVKIIPFVLAVLVLSSCKSMHEDKQEQSDAMAEMVEDYSRRLELKQLVADNHDSESNPWVYIPTGLSFGNKRLSGMDEIFRSGNAGKTLRVSLIFPDSGYPTHLSSRHIRIVAGSVTLRTPSGFVTFHPNGQTSSKVDAESKTALAVFEPNLEDPLYGDTYQNIIIGCRKSNSSGRKAHLSMNLVGLKRGNEISYSDLLHSLPVENKKGAGVIEFEIEFSLDFKGSFSKWFILPNWS